jgi:hypothetical protein
MAPRRNPSMSDRRLHALLKQLRENPAAPQDFRAKVLGRLAEDGLIPSVAAAKPGLRERLSAWLRPWPLGLAASCALALVLLLRPVAAPRPVAQPLALVARPAVQPAESVRRPLAQSKAQPVPAAGEAPAQSVQVFAPEVAMVQEPVQVQAPEAVGAAAQPKTQAVVQVAGVTATVGPEPRLSGKTLPTLGSEVRNNVVRMSQGQPSDVHFSFTTTGHVRVDILDRLGREVAVLFDGTLANGEYDGNGAAPLNCPWCLWNNMTVNGDMAASGIYLVRIQTPDYVHIHKLMLIK